MTTGQAPKIAAKYSLSRLRRRAHVRVPVFGFVIAALLTVFAVPTTLLAALDPATEAEPVQPAVYEVLAQTEAPPSDAVVPPVKRERPGDPPATAAPKADAVPPAVAPTTAQSPSAPRDAADGPDDETVPGTGIFGTLQEWLARANREYQGIVVKELSMPSPGPPPGTAPLPPTERDDPIAKKLAEQQAEDARKAADAKAAADAARKTAEAKAAADAKAAEAKKLAEDRLRAEETKRLADETKRKADELLKDAATPAMPPQPPVTETSEQQRREAQKVADENKRQEQLRQADAERRADAERKRLEAVRAENERRVAADEAAASQMHRRRTFVLTAEPISRPDDREAVYRLDVASSRATDVHDEAPSRRTAMDRAYAAGSYPGTAVKPWVRRVSAGHCSAAGRRITPPGRYTVKRGDSLWRISKRHYRKGKLYGRLYSANRSRIRNPNLIYPCQRVLVPKKRR